MRFVDGTFRFFVAEFGSWADDATIVFRVRYDRIPEERAAEKGIKGYDRIRPAKDFEIARWLESHPSFQPIH